MPNFLILSEGSLYISNDAQLIHDIHGTFDIRQSITQYDRGIFIFTPLIHNFQEKYF